MDCGRLKRGGRLMEVEKIEEPSLGLWLLAAYRWQFNSWSLNRGSTVFDFIEEKKRKLEKTFIKAQYR